MTTAVGPDARATLAFTGSQVQLYWTNGFSSCASRNEVPLTARRLVSRHRRRRRHASVLHAWRHRLQQPRLHFAAARSDRPTLDHGANRAGPDRVRGRSCVRADIHELTAQTALTSIASSSCVRSVPSRLTGQTQPIVAAAAVPAESTRSVSTRAPLLSAATSSPAPVSAATSSPTLPVAPSDAAEPVLSPQTPTPVPPQVCICEMNVLID